MASTPIISITPLQGMLYCHIEQQRELLEQYREQIGHTKQWKHMADTNDNNYIEWLRQVDEANNANTSFLRALQDDGPDAQRIKEAGGDYIEALRRYIRDHFQLVQA